jgi:hypothetical protein
MYMFRRIAAGAALSLLMVLPARSALQKAQDDLAVTATGRSVLVDVLANDAALGADLRILKAFKPAHGSVAIENGKVRYTPAAGYQGSDTFRYMAQAPASQPGEATVNVEVGHGGVSLRIAGRVIDGAIPYARVTVSIGGFDFIANADANGNYVLDVAALRGDAFVTLVATGTSTAGAAVRFYSAVGEMARLSAAAGSDGVLVRDEFNQVNVTNLSTAQYTLLAQANGGTPVGSDQQLLPLVQNIDLDKMLELAAVIKLVVDEGAALPAGTTDALALISDPTALASFEAALPIGALDVAKDEVIQDPVLTPGFRQGNVPSTYALVAPSAPGTIRVGLVGIPFLSFDNSGGTSGTGKAVEASQDSDPRFNWSIDAGDLVLNFVLPFEYAGYQVNASDFGCAGDAVYVEHDTALGMRVHRIQDGGGVDYVEETDATMRRFDDPDTSDSCVPPPDGQVAASYRFLAFRDGAGEIPFAPGESFGRVGMGYYLPATGTFQAAVFDFDAHTTSIPGFNPAFSSSIVNGRLQVVLTHTASGLTITNEYRRYQLDGSKGEGLVMIATLPDGNQVSNSTLMSRDDGSGPFLDATMAGTWRSGFDISQFPNGGAVVPGFFIVLNNDAAHTEYQHTVDPLGGVIDSFPSTWSVEGGDMVARSYRQPGVGRVPSCAPYSPGTCYQARERRWTPVARDGKRVYVLETLSDRSSSVAAFTVSARMNFYELQ